MLLKIDFKNNQHLLLMNYPTTLDFNTLITEHAWLDIINTDILKKCNDTLNDEIEKCKFNNTLHSRHPMSSCFRITNNEIYPYNPEHIFRVFNLIKPKDIKVVILGQDPYYANKDQANGIAFDVNEDVKIPPSLKNIYKELTRSGLRKSCSSENHNLPIDWVQQGVFMLNTSLTVRQKEANSHIFIWKEFTEHIINLINEKCKGVIFIAWGKFSQDCFKNTNRKLNINLNNHILLTSSHPSPLSATKTDKPFISSNVFNRINEILKTQNKDPINW